MIQLNFEGQKIYPQFQNYGNNFKIPPKENEMNENSLYDSLKYFFLYSKIFGLFPIRKNEQGVVQCGLLSFTNFFTLGIILALSTLNYFVVKTVVGTIANHSLTFEESITYGSMLALPSVFTMPMISFLETRKIAEFFTEWGYFQNRFEKITSIKCIVLQSKLYNASLVATPFVGLALTAFWKPDFDAILNKYYLDKQRHYFFMCFFVYFGGLLGTYYYIWITFNRSLRTATDHLITDIQSLRWKTYKSLKSRLHLWLNIRQLCNQLGDVMCLTYLYCCFAFFVTALPSLYVGSYKIFDGEFYHLLVSINPLMGIYLICDISHRTADKVGPEFEKTLINLLVSGKAIGWEKELNQFIDKVADNRPIISLGGLFNMTRGIFVPLASSIITYVIIIVQFRMDS